MKMLKLAGFRIPDLVLCDTYAEAKAMREQGIPYVLLPKGVSERQIALTILLPVLRNKFPELNWRRVLEDEARETGVRIGSIYVPEDENDMIIRSEGGEAKSSVSDAGEASPTMELTDGYREFECGGKMRRVAASDWLDPKGFNVNIEDLMALKLMPQFMSDITECIKQNITGATQWSDGYTRKLGCCLGEYNVSQQKRNLIIIDVSCSIPRGVSYTMARLCGTLREQCNADLIITSGTSHYFRHEDPLPDWEWFRKVIATGNESYEFNHILKTHILGKEWGNVICFGDYDTPIGLDQEIHRHRLKESLVKSTRIEKVWPYHTHCSGVYPGYLIWTKLCDVGQEEGVNTTWVRYLK